MTPPPTEHDTSAPSGTASATVGGIIDALGSKQPTPGGGAAAPIVMALAAALGRMVVGFSQGKKQLAEHEPMLAAALISLENHANAALSLADQDAAAYAQLNKLWKLPAADPRRAAEWEDAVTAAINAPRAVMAACIDVLEQLKQLVGRSNAMLASDLAIAAILADAAARAASWNIRINLPQVSDVDAATQYRNEMDGLLHRAQSLATEIELACG